MFYHKTPETLRIVRTPRKPCVSANAHTREFGEITVFYAVYFDVNPAGNYLFEVNNRNTRTRCEICSKLTIKTPERHLASFWCLYC